ncbi:lactone biosynthesis protein [Streptomyces mashuensis]|uniref:Lactone biosynthesis protein n=1 Tax=Streptomyces mashuensis TaxID=33904 RepID=A0A919AWS7_9ACTN|nr:ScbA/BarX family gamma-butyrolactone biosynthesis protein [Streptomyces mashuensis]GHF30080.1 lactone biosynthesis protein [Streptomyces mashuensis]
MYQRSAVPVDGVSTEGDPAMTSTTRSTGLSFLQPVSRQLVHRAAVAEVFVTDGIREDDGRFLVAAQWPRDHALYHPDDHGLADPLLLAETIRQAAFYLAHAEFSVPQGHPFVARGLDFEITDPEALRVGHAPQLVFLEARWAWEDLRPPRRYDFRLELSLVVDGRPCGRGGLRGLAVPPRSYALLRRRSTDAASVTAAAARLAGPGGPRTMPPHQVGRLRSKDCVLEAGERPGEWLLRPPLDHAILFDHPTDHVPFMVMLEGFRQLGHLRTHGGSAAPGGPEAYTLTSVDAECGAFAELDEPVRLVVREETRVDGPDGPVRLVLDALQGDAVASSARTVWSPRPVAAEATAGAPAEPVPLGAARS